MSLKSVQNNLYKVTINIGANKITQVLWYFVHLLFFSNPFVVSSKFKVILLKIFGAKIKQGVIIKPGVRVKYPWKLSIGAHSWIGENVWIDNLCSVVIGKNVCISQGVMLLTGSHDHTKVTFDFIANEILLEDGVWIGAKAVVVGGVVCKSHSILGVNGVAESNLEGYTIYKGNPAIPVVKRMVS